MAGGTPPWRDGEPPVACPRGCGRTVHWNPCETAETRTFAEAMEQFYPKQVRRGRPAESPPLGLETALSTVPLTVQDEQNPSPTNPEGSSQ